ncbi:MAG TPA: SpoIIE family protein phosphatase [Streptosporangiaceae bacterium]|nr:SpoIIE family protein phosphatase [Streptosporangiaceae bacterium]
MREVFASLPAAVAYLAGDDLVFEFANDQYSQLVGGREVLGLPVREAFPELAGQGRFGLLRKVMESGQPLRGHETELWIRRGGERLEQVFVDFLYQPVRDGDGAVAGVLLFAADVTANVRDRRGNESLAAQLVATQERYRTLFETLPQGVIHYAADGLIIGANPAASEILGLGPDEMITWPMTSSLDAVHEDGSPFRAEEFPVTAALRTGEVVADVVMGVPHARTGEMRWLMVTAVPDARDRAGRPQRAYAMFRDLTDQRRVEATLREGTELMGRLREANVLGVVVNGEDRVHDANDAFLDIVGYSRADMEAGRISYRSITPPGWAASDADALQQLRRTGAFRPYEKEYLHRDGHRVPVLVGAAVVGHNPLRWVSFIVDLTARQRAEQERAALLARERAALAEAGSARERLAFLLRAGDLVAAGQHRHELLQHASQLVVHSLADFCMVYLPAGDGILRATSIAYRDAAGAVAFADLRGQPVSTIGRQATRAAYATGTSQLVRDVAARAAGRSDLTPPLQEIMARLRPETGLVVPLMTGQHPLGVLAMGRGAERPRFARADIEVVEELGRRMAVGLANADMSARDHTVAETLQRSVLPDTLPEIAGLDLAVRYLPGTDGIDVGGDWYDAFPLDANRVGLAVGDVVGHNITSASIMSQVRNLLRAYAVDKVHPSDVLRSTNAALARLLPEAMATAVYAVLDVTTGNLSYANAGHPPPVCASADGRVEYLDAAAGAMLGAPGGHAFTTGRRQLAPGTGLLLYTDGLIEDRRRDITDGFRALAGAMHQAASCSAERTCAAVQTALLGSTPRADDVCLLAARLAG